MQVYIEYKLDVDYKLMWASLNTEYDNSNTSTIFFFLAANRGINRGPTKLMRVDLNLTEEDWLLIVKNSYSVDYFYRGEDNSCIELLLIGHIYSIVEEYKKDA